MENNKTQEHHTILAHYLNLVYEVNCLLNIQGLFLFQHIAEQKVHIVQNNYYRIDNPWQLRLILCCSHCYYDYGLFH